MTDLATLNSDNCKQCDQLVLNENSICCDICNTWYHLKCTSITLKIFKTMFVASSVKWYCKLCIIEALPFGNISNNIFLSQVCVSKTNKTLFDLIESGIFNHKCSICNKKINNNKGIPCSACNCLIHKKCSKTRKIDFCSNEIKTWFCPLCVKNNLPFMDLDDFELAKTISSSSNNVSINKIKMLNLKELFRPHVLNTKLNNINCDYYDIDMFHKLCEQQLSTKKNFSIFHTNVSSLQGNFEKLELLLHQLNFNFDIISLTETWNPSSMQTSFNSNHLLGYQKYVGQTGTTMKSGCGFYISENINFIPRKDLDIHLYNRKNEFECKWIEIINKKKPNSLIATIYRHPSKNDDAFLEYLKKTLDLLRRENKLIFLTGDFNLNLLNHDTNTQVDNFLNILYSNFCQSYIVLPTRIVDNAKPSLLDNIFANTIEHDPISGNLTNKISDHLPNFLILQQFDKDIKPIKITRRNYTKFKEDQFITDINNANIKSKIESSDDTNEKYDILHNHILSTINKHAPLKTLSNSESKNLLKPWITKGLLKSIKLKNKYYHKYIKNKDPFWYTKYKHYRDNINHLIRTSKHQYYKNYFRTFRNSSKKVWSGIKSIICNKKSTHPSINVQVVGEIITNQQTVANEFNNFFINVGPILSSNIPKTNKIFTDYLKQPTKNSMFLTPTNPTEIFIINIFRK